jgi:hypothetical protein
MLLNPLEIIKQKGMMNLTENLTAKLHYYNVSIMIDIKFPELKIEKPISFISYERPTLDEVWDALQEGIKVKNMLQYAKDAGGRDLYEYEKMFFEKYNFKKYLQQGYLEIKKVFTITEPNGKSYSAMEMGSEESGCFYLHHIKDKEAFFKRFSYYVKRSQIA